MDPEAFRVFNSYIPTVRNGFFVEVGSPRPSIRLANAARDGDVRVLSLLKADVARRLLGIALLDDDFIANPDAFSEGSTGEAARRLLRVCFKDLNPEVVRSFAESEPGRFESQIQSAMALSDD